jgi:hypothetical protein
MGYATTRSLERVAAAMGQLASAPIEFQTACDVPQGGVLLALPALLAQGLLRYSPQMYQLPEGFYGIDSIFLLLHSWLWRGLGPWNSCAMSRRASGANC